MADIRAKALAYLRDGKVRVLVATTSGLLPDAPYAVVARVQGYSATHMVRLRITTDWQCTCPLKTGCAHIAAVQLVTGHPSAAQKKSEAASGATETAPDTKGVQHV